MKAEDFNAVHVGFHHSTVLTISAPTKVETHFIKKHCPTHKPLCIKKNMSITELLHTW